MTTLRERQLPADFIDSGAGEQQIHGKYGYGRGSSGSQNHRWRRDSWPAAKQQADPIWETDPWGMSAKSSQREADGDRSYSAWGAERDKDGYLPHQAWGAHVSSADYDQSAMMKPAWARRLHEPLEEMDGDSNTWSSTMPDGTSTDSPTPTFAWNRNYEEGYDNKKGGDGWAFSDHHPNK